METDVQGCSSFRAKASRAILAFATAIALATPVTTARATGSLGTPGIEPIEQRIAIAVSQNQTTLWTSLSFDGAAGKLAVVLPLPVGAALDKSSRAFFEALQVATTPRIIPPNGARSICQGGTPGPGVAVEGDLDGSAALPPTETTVFADASSLEAWAASNGLVVSQSTLMALATYDSATRFVAMRYDVPGGAALTQTLRAVVPGSAPMLPLLLTTAKSSGLRVVTWEVGPGRSQVQGSEVEIDLDNLAFDVAKGTSNYGALRSGLLVDAQQILVESASHEALRDNLSVGTSTESVTSFAKTYFSRAKSYGDATGDDITCTFQSAVALGKANVIANACPRADLGFVEVGGNCQETVGTGQIDPATLRCGGASDDLALMLSGLVGGDTWLTRSTLVIPAGKMGADLAVSFPTGQRVDPIYSATSVDLSGCGGQSSSSSSTGSSMGSAMVGAGSTGPGSPTDVPLYRYSGCSCSGAYEQVGTVEVDSTDAPSGYYENPNGCSTDTSTYASQPDNCSGDTSTSGDTCGSGSGSSTSTSSDGCSNSDGSSGCSGDSSTGSDSCSSGSSDGCGSSGSSDSCGGSSGSSNNCAVASGKRGRVLRFAPRLSGLVYGLVVLIAPLRRWSRTKKKRRNPKRKARA